MPTDYYETLGVGRAASDEEVRRAFRKKAMEFHPDRNKTPGAEDTFKEINEAYQVLSDQEKRSRYDRFGHAGVNGGGDRPFDGFDPFGGFGDIFDTFFGGGTRTANQARAGEDISQRITLTFEEAVFGCERDIEITRVETCGHCSGAGNEPGTTIDTCSTCNGAGQVRRAQRSVFGQFAVTTPCPSCNGTGRSFQTPCTNCRARGQERRRRTRTVTIPAGVDDGMQVRITGEGSAGTNGGPAGNLYVQVRVQDHPLFWREDFDLMHRIEINVAEASLGVTKPIPTLEGEPVDLEIPAGTQSGSYFRVRGLGVPHLRRNGRPTDRRGDIRVMVDIDVPTKLNKYQRKLLEDLEYSFSNGGKAPPKPRRSSAKGKASPSSEIDEETPVSATEDDGLGDEVSVESVESEEKQRGLFDRIKGTFSPNPDD
jgi:molecular chaperone DnaJ